MKTLIKFFYRFILCSSESTKGVHDARHSACTDFSVAWRSVGPWAFTGYLKQINYRILIQKHMKYKTLQQYYYV